jgi:exodeoxyribonuclease V alpha subunit
VLVATALLAHMEGQGHSCLPLDALARAAGPWAGWPPSRQEALAALWQSLPAPAQTGWPPCAPARCVQAHRQAADTGPAGAGRLADAALALPAPLLAVTNSRWPQPARARCATPPMSVEPRTRRVRSGWTACFRRTPAPPDIRPAGCDWQKLACALALRGA